MNCEQAIDLLGQYVDGELPPAVSVDLKTHLAKCTSCRVELGTLSELAAELAAGPIAPVPDNLWTAIEERLASDTGILTDATSHGAVRMTGRSGWRRNVAWAIAASVLMGLGLSMFDTLRVDSPARAATVDFSVLLDALPVDAKKAFQEFVALYDAKPSSPMGAKRFAANLDFELPQELPGGFRLDDVYLLKFGKNPGVAATYERDGDFIGTVFHPPVNRENYGPHPEYPCMVGDYEGHKVSVGQWRLVHLMTPTTCHCVLSRLSESSELPDIMAAVAPNLPAGTTRHEHCE